MNERRATLFAGITLLGAVAIAAAAGWRAACLYETEGHAHRAHATMHQLHAATRALLGAREPLTRLAEDWRAARTSGTEALATLDQGVSAVQVDAVLRTRLNRLDDAWAALDREHGASPDQIGGIQLSRLAEITGDAGIVLAYQRALNDPDSDPSTIPILDVVQRRLEEFDLRTRTCVDELTNVAKEVGARARLDARLAGGGALVVLMIAATAAATALIGIGRSNRRLRDELSVRRSAEQGLERLSQRQRMLLTTLPDLIFVVARDGTYREALGNTSILLLPIERLVGSRPRDFLPADVAAAREEAIERAFATGLPQRLEQRIPIATGLRDYDVRINVVGEDDAVVVVSDITDRLRLEEQLRHAQKLEAVGQLAGGIAHDFNNLLVGILGYAELLAQSARDPQGKRQAEAIVRAATRAAELTGQMLAFSRKGPRALQPIDANAVVSDALGLLRHSVDRRIRIATDLRADGAWVRGDRARLQSALINLGINARDAMPDGGEFRLASDRLALPGDDADAPLALVAGDYLRLRASDTGMGMDDDTRRRAFEPFFTTKGPGRGTGLGLAAVYGIVADMAGAIAVSSALGRGTTFTIWLPLCAEPAATAVPTAGAAAVCGRILVVDDEPMVRDLAAELLRRLGWTVDCATDGADGLARFGAQHYDAVLLDLMMPRMSGETCFRAMRAAKPTVPIILATGYADTELIERLRADGGAVVLTKPYRASDIAAALAQATRG